MNLKRGRALLFDRAVSELRWNLLVPLGKTKHRGDLPKGGVVLDRALLKRMVENFARAKRAYLGADGFGLPITLTHVGPSIPSNPRPIEERRAVGWIEDLKLDEVGLWGLTKWTDEARQRISKDEFRYLSPEFALETLDSDLGVDQGATLFGAALLNDPFFTEMPRVAASATAEAERPKGSAMEFLKKLCAMLGLPEGTSEDDVMTKLSSAMKPQGFASEVEKLTAARAGDQKELSRLTGENKVLDEQVKTLSATVDALKATAEKAEAETKKAKAMAFVRELLETKKIAAIQQDELVAFAAEHGVERLEKLYKNAPAIVPTGPVGVESNTSGFNKDEDRKQFNAKVDELIKGGKTAADAARLAKVAMPEVASRLFARQ